MKKDKLDIMLEVGIGLMTIGWGICVMAVGVAFMFGVLQLIKQNFSNFIVTIQPYI